MARIEGIRVKNFKVLKDVALGHLWKQTGHQPLTALTAVIGRNGVGKSALLDALGFLADALKPHGQRPCSEPLQERFGLRNLVTGGRGCLSRWLAQPCEQGAPGGQGEKIMWSETIAPLMDVDNNAPPSFQYFRSKIRELG